MTTNEGARVGDRGGGNKGGCRPSVGTSAAQSVGRRWGDERASATVVMLGVIGAVMVLTISGLLLASAVLASHRARAAADLAALAAAGVLMRGDPVGAACTAGTRVAAANHASVRLCSVSGSQVRLTVVVPAGVKGIGVATARSRAGPSPSEQ